MKQTQTEQILTQNNFALKKLKGIKPKGVKARDKTIFESLLEPIDYIMDKHLHRIDSRIYQKAQVKDEIDKELESDILKSVDLTSNDLKNCIYALNIIEKGQGAWNINQRSLLGIYTGCLLDLWTKRQKEDNKRAVFYMNGEGIIFDDLFSYTKNIDILMLDNFKGTGICGLTGTHKGNVNCLITKHIEGLFTAERTGAYAGNAGLVIASKNKLMNPFGVGGHEGFADIVLMNNCELPDGGQVGNYAGSYKGNVNMFLSLFNRINYISQDLAHDGSAECINVDEVLPDTKLHSEDLDLVYSWSARGKSNEKHNLHNKVFGKKAFQRYQEFISMFPAMQILDLVEEVGNSTRSPEDILLEIDTLYKQSKLKN